jgi:flagellar basal body rod protein FlgG
MMAGIAAAFSGIQTGGKILTVNAHNIANAQTPGFTRTRVLPLASPAGGVTYSLDQVQAGSLSVSDEGSPSEDTSTTWEGSDVDMGEEMISTLQAVHLIEANLASMRIQDRLLGSLLDITE